ncbi:hypothetical protein ACLOJK_016484 [Asimina triloba]
MDKSQVLVISLGTGLAKDEKKFSAKQASKWGDLGCLLEGADSSVNITTKANLESLVKKIGDRFAKLLSDDRKLRKINERGVLLLYLYVAYDTYVMGQKMEDPMGFSEMGPSNGLRSNPKFLRTHDHQNIVRKVRSSQTKSGLVSAPNKARARKILTHSTNLCRHIRLRNRSWKTGRRKDENSPKDSE